ncbi:MAG: HIT family protein [Chitinophagales bacterium]|nr:HIT family protein [Chitinophagales bacterium]MDW8419063.1 HIT family protein [Chitinophagales bacterium]
MPSIFSRIIAGEIPCYKVAEDKNYFAFLDINPLAKGHTLVIPKKEVDYIFDLDEETLSGLFLFSRKVARAIQQTVPCLRIGIAVVGLEVPHAHVHLVPLQSVHDIDFSRPRVQMTKEEMAELARLIASNFT